LSLENQLAQTKLEIESGVKSIARGAICDAEVDAVMPNLRRRCEQPEAELAPWRKLVARRLPTASSPGSTILPPPSLAA
jgi:hypothetical protein